MMKEEVSHDDNHNHKMKNLKEGEEDLRRKEDNKDHNYDPLMLKVAEEEE
jgi:hypothetical protein